MRRVALIGVDSHCRCRAGCGDFFAPCGAREAKRDGFDGWHPRDGLGGFIGQQVAIGVERQRDLAVAHERLDRLRTGAADRRPGTSGVAQSVEVDDPPVMISRGQEVGAFSLNPL
ncbi:MAG: hypothetical protein AAGG07_06340 [Planctomycetota bacterium]